MSPGALVRHLPNAITALRLSALPLLVLLVLECREAVAAGGSGGTARLGATALLLAIGVGDVVDGVLARRLHGVTSLGSILDPLADKLAQLTGLVLFTRFAEPAFHPLPGALLVALVSRDLVLLAGFAALRLRGRRFEVRAGRVGKGATVATFSLLVGTCAGLDPAVLSPLTWASGGLIVLSGLLYVSHGIGLWRGAPVASGSPGEPPAGREG